MERLFEELIDGAAAGRFEEAVRRSPLSKAAPRLHPLNFVAIRTGDERGSELRLHVWDRRFRFGQPGFEIHDHSFDLDSYVACGRLEQVVYEAEAREDGDLDVFAVRYGPDGGSMLAPSARRTALRETDRRMLTRGERNRLPHGSLHSLELRGESAMTLVLTRERGTPPVSIGPFGANGPATLRETVRDAEGRPLDLTRCGLADIAEAAAARVVPTRSIPT